MPPEGISHAMAAKAASVMSLSSNRLPTPTAIPKSWGLEAATQASLQAPILNARESAQTQELRRPQLRWQFGRVSDILPACSMPVRASRETPDGVATTRITMEM